MPESGKRPRRCAAMERELCCRVSATLGGETSCAAAPAARAIRPRAARIRLPPAFPLPPKRQLVEAIAASNVFPRNLPPHAPTRRRPNHEKHEESPLGSDGLSQRHDIITRLKHGGSRLDASHDGQNNSRGMWGERGNFPGSGASRMTRRPRWRRTFARLAWFLQTDRAAFLHTLKWP